MDQRRLRAAVVLAVGVLGLAATALRSEEVRSLRTAAAPAGERARGVKADVTAAPDSLPVDEGAYRRLLSAARIERAMNDYQKVSAFPPWSRVHDEGTSYLMKWNEAVTPDLPFGDEPGNETGIRFGADRAHVMRSEALTTFIEVWRVKDGAKLPVTIEAAYVLAVSGAPGGRIAQLAYHDDGKDGDEVAGDNRYTNRFVPSSEPEMQVPRQMVIRAEVDLHGVKTAVTRDFTFSPRRVVEVLAMRDAVEGGNLVVSLDVDVREAGVHTFQANVVGEGGQEPIAYADTHYSLAVGKQTVKVPFFGKAFHDKGLDGPYLVRDIRGFLRSFGPEANLLWSEPRTLTTRAWKRSDMSPSEWDAPERHATLDSMRQLAAQTASGELARQPARHIHVGADGVHREVVPR